MVTQTLTLELPQELIKLLGSAEDASARARQALILDLLRESKISQGKAAELLGITRWDMLDLMVEHRIPSGPRDAAEMRKEVNAIKDFPTPS